MSDILRTTFGYKERASQDKLGRYPEKVHVMAMPERRYLWTSRILTIFSCLSLCLTIMFASTIYLLVPQKRVKPRLLTIDNKFNSLKLVERFEVNTAVTDLVADMLVAEYMQLRHTIINDVEEMERRWGKSRKLFWYSGPASYAPFELEAKYNMQLLKLKGLTRKIKINWLTPTTRGLWLVEFYTYDYLPELEKPIVNIWRATLRVGYGSVPFKTKNDVMYNPYGFQVYNYSVAYRGTPEASESYLKEAKKYTEELYRR